MILKILDSILPGSGAIIRIAIKAVEVVTTAFVDTVRNDWQQIQKNYRYRLSSMIRNEIININAQMQELERKRFRDGGLNRYDQETFDEFKYNAQKLAEEHQQARSKETTDELFNSTEVAATKLSNDYLHILDWSRGPTVPQKRCPHCGSAMYLNRKNTSTKVIFTTNDYFWACINFYRADIHCKGTRSFSENDFALLHHSGIPELEITKKEFDLITSQKPVQKIAQRRLSNLRGAQDIDVICPSHGLPMELDVKNNALDFNDLYYLRCPYPSCGQTRKLKDNAQLASFLERVSGEGMLS